MKALTRFFAGRYVAGESREDALRTAASLNERGLAATIDYLGENVGNEAQAGAAADEYVALLEDIAAAGLDASASFKLTHMGLDIAESLALENAERIIEKAARLGNFLRFDMEGSRYTEKTIELFCRLFEKYRNIGIAIQAYLYRSEADVERLVSLGASVRLCKGAYREPAEIAWPRKADVDRSYERLMKLLLLGGNRPALATHDTVLIDKARRFAADNDIDPRSFEFQMLMGIKRSLQQRLADEGYRVKVYVPYGSHWLPYMLRRVRERRENLFFVLRNILD